MGNVKLPSFYVPRGDTRSVRLWPRYLEDLDMIPTRKIAPGTIIPQGEPDRHGAKPKGFQVPKHDFDNFTPGRTPGPTLWAAFLPVGYGDPKRDDYPHWADQLRPFFTKALAFYSGKTKYDQSFYLVSNDLSLLMRAELVYKTLGPKKIDYYSINTKGPGAFKNNPAGYVRVQLEKYRSLEDFLAFAGNKDKVWWMDEGWQSPKIFAEHMKAKRRRIVWWNVHSNPEISLVSSEQAAKLENGGLIALLNGCSVGGFAQPGSASFVDTGTPPARNLLCSLVYGHSAFVVAQGSVHNRVNDEHGVALFKVLYSPSGYLGLARAAQLRDQNASNNPDEMRQFQDILIGDPFVDVHEGQVFARGTGRLITPAPRREIGLRKIGCHAHACVGMPITPAPGRSPPARAGRGNADAEPPRAPCPPRARRTSGRRRAARSGPRPDAAARARAW